MRDFPMISTTPTLTGKLTTALMFVLLTGKLTTALMFVYFRKDVLPAVQRYILKTGFKTAIKAMFLFLPSISACEEWLPIGVMPLCQLNRQLPILINYNQSYLTHDFTSECFECFSIEDAKQKAEHDKMMKEAEERKQEVRRIIAQLRRQIGRASCRERV